MDTQKFGQAGTYQEELGFPFKKKASVSQPIKSTEAANRLTPPFQEKPQETSGEERPS